MSFSILFKLIAKEEAATYCVCGSEFTDNEDMKWIACDNPNVRKPALICPLFMQRIEEVMGSSFIDTSDIYYFAIWFIVHKLQEVSYMLEM